MTSEERSQNIVVARIYTILQELSIKPQKQIRTFNYLTEAIQIAYENQDAIYEYDEKIYGPIAKKYDITIEVVKERIYCITCDIPKRCNSGVLEKYFGKIFHNCKSILEGRVIIAILVAYMHMQDKPQTLSSRISELMVSLGILPGTTGFRYISTAIEITYKKPTAIYNITREIYVPITILYNTTVNAIEKTMRFTIEQAWSRGDSDSISKCFKDTVYKRGGVPTNAQFILATTEYLRLQINLQNQNEERIINILNELGVFHEHKGYKYLKEAIQRVYENPRAIYRLITKMARKYELNYITLCLNMKRAICIIWEKLTPEIFEKYFDETDIVMEENPTNINFIKAIVEYLHAEDAKVS